MPVRAGLLLCVLILGLFCASASRAAYYDHAAYPFAWIDPASHDRVVWTGASGGPAPACSGGSIAVDDDISEELALGFSFNFGGVAYNSVRVMTNGRLQFNNTYCYYGTQTVTPRTYTLPYANANLPRTLRIYGADLDPTLGGAAAYVSYTQQGSAPNRQFVVTWTDVPDFGNSSSRFNLQMILRENGDFVYQFGNIVNSTGGKAQSGWELSTSDYDTLAFNAIEDLQNSAVRFFRANNLADWRMEGDFTDSSGNGYNGAGVNGASTVFANDPAYASGGQNTCQYAQLDTSGGGEKRYIRLDSLTSASFNSSFTVTAWLRSNDAGASGQRILVNDDAQDGWALSLADGASGRLRLFNRNQVFSGATGGGSTSGEIFDAPAVIANNSWYFAAAAVDLYLNKATLYIYDSNGVLLANTSADFNSSIWCPTGKCTGAIALGGETLASSEGVSANFHFKGNLDEVRLWQGLLSQSYVASVLSRTRPCAAPATTTPAALNAVDVGAHAVSGQIATKTAGTAFSLDIYALNAARTAQDGLASGAVLVDLLANSATGVARDGNNCPVSGTALSVGTVTLAAGKATAAVGAVSNSWRDVRVRMRYPATGTATVIACSSDNFAVKPAYLSAIASHADWQTAGVTTPLANTGASGGVLHKAGRPFTLRVTGYNAGNVMTGNYDGSPSASTACVLPASGCVAGTLSTGAFSASAGTLTSGAASYSEVGAIAATFTDTGYASVDSDDTAASCAGYYVCASAIDIGRFVPDHFDIAANSPAFLPACGGFTYLGQPFGFGTGLGAAPDWTVIARNYTGATTRNYTGSLFKIAAGTVTGQAWSATGGTVAAVGGLPAVGVTDLGGGQASLVFGVGDPAGGGGLAFARAALTAPFDASLTLAASVADSEGVAHAGNPYLHGGIGFDDANAGTTNDAQMRFGRLRLSNAVGSEMLALPVSLSAQYWNGQGFAANTADNCTPLAAPALTFYADSADNRLASGETVPSFNATLVAGGGNLRLSAPGAGNFGYLDLAIGAATWLKYNWDGVDQGGDANLFDDNPRARAAFGKRKGSDKVIIRREIY
ncbi:MAG: hypothetical protein B7Y41_02035 [Hydrogenophilales bacterium 28-61-23]|nr:MAG: hypothetical protein B7Y41_02035 [Hydrogenophilales bacterium 28-61-23]